MNKMKTLLFLFGFLLGLLVWTDSVIAQDDDERYSLGMATSSLLSIIAPEDEQITVNLYEPDGEFGMTIYEGDGGVFIVSLRGVADEKAYDFLTGKNKIILYGEEGKYEMEFEI